MFGSKALCQAFIQFRSRHVRTRLSAAVCFDRLPAMSDKKLLGKIALITGASKGLGKAMALALAEAGAKLALVSRNLDQLKAVAQEVRALGAEAEVFQADVTDEGQVRELQHDVIAKFGRIQILINNAGINIRKPVTEL